MEMEEKRHDKQLQGLDAIIENKISEKDALKEENEVGGEHVKKLEDVIEDKDQYIDRLKKRPETKEEATDRIEHALSNLDHITGSDILFELLLSRKREIDEAHRNTTKHRAHLETICKNLQ